MNPAFAKLEFPAGLANVGRLHLVDNGFRTINGLDFNQATHVELRSLAELSSVSLPNLERVQNDLDIALNAPSLSVSVNTF